MAATATAARPELAENRTSVRSPAASAGGQTMAVMLIVAGVSFVATIVATTRYGIGLTPDSFVYLTGAQSLAAGHGYASDGSAVTVFAPGYSAVVSLAEHIGLSAGGGARVLAAVCAAASVALGYALLRRHIHSRRIIIGATVAIGCSAVMLQTFDEALSEHLFILVVLLFILAAENVMSASRVMLPVATVVVLTWAAFYVRYAGIVLVPIAAAIVLIALWRRSRGRALASAAAVLVAGVALPAVWMKRNVDAGSGLLGSRQDAAASPLTNVARTSRELSSWLATSWTPGALRVVLFLAAVVLLVLAVAGLVRGRLTLPTDARDMLPAVLVTSVYLIYLAVTASLVAFAAINARFLAPVFIPAVVVAAWVFERVRPQVSQPVRRVITVVAAVWLAISLLWFGGVLVSSARSGAGGYASDHWHDSKLLDDVRSLDETAPVYTNDSVAIELFTGRVVKLSVARTFFASNEETGSLPGFLQTVKCAGRVELVWFQPNGRPRLYSPDELAQYLRLEPRVQRGEGVIYDVTPKPGDTSTVSCR
jgi:hypothetical protein